MVDERCDDKYKGGGRVWSGESVLTLAQRVLAAWQMRMRAELG
jgi:hypothetical protein